MSRYGPMFGPDITFLGVDRCDLDDPSTFADAEVVVVGAPFDGGTSHRPGTRFGPQAIRSTDYLPHDGSRPHLSLRVDGLRDLRVLDAGDVEIALAVERPDLLAVLLAHGAEVDQRRGRLGAELLEELAPGAGLGLLGLVVLALWDRPGAGVLPGPQRPSGMHQQHLDGLAAPPVEQDPRAVPGHACSPGG